MGKELHRIQRRKKSIERINNIIKKAESTLVIHYSCESFYNREDGTSPRITSIAIRNLASGQTDSYSIHQVAEEEQILFEDINKHYNTLEKKMLKRFFDFVNTHQNFTWIHWNMRDVNYGFAAIEHRYRVLGGKPVQISETNKFDISRALVDIYGIAYIGHPRLESLMRKNQITNKDFLSGKDEAEAFDKKLFIKLHQSTLRKVDTIANIFERTADGTLKTNASWREQHGYTLQAAAEYIQHHWLIITITVIACIITFILRFIDLIAIFNKYINFG